MSKDLAFAMSLSNTGKKLHELSHEFLNKKPETEDDYKNLFKKLDRLQSEITQAKLKYTSRSIEYLKRLNS